MINIQVLSVFFAKKYRTFALAGLVLAMGISCSWANDIVLTIFPSSKFKFSWQDGLSKAMMTYSTLSGFKKDQVELRPFKANEYSGCGNKMISPKDIERSFLNDDVRKVYSLYHHRRFKYLDENDRLIIKKWDETSRKFVQINMPDSKAKRLLSHLKTDTLDESVDCCDLCAEVFFDSHDEKNRFSNWRNSHVLTEQQGESDGEQEESDDYENFLREETDESSLKPGDGLVFFMGDFKEEIFMVHWSIALGDGLYISKIGIGGRIFVHDMDAALDIYPECNGFCRIGIFDDKKSSSGDKMLDDGESEDETPFDEQKIEALLKMIQAKEFEESMVDDNGYMALSVPRLELTSLE